MHACVSSIPVPVAVLSEALLKYHSSMPKDKVDDFNLTFIYTHHEERSTHLFDQAQKAILNSEKLAVNLYFMPFNIGVNLPHIEALEKNIRLIKYWQICFGISNGLIRYVLEGTPVDEQGYYVDDTLECCNQLTSLKLYYCCIKTLIPTNHLSHTHSVVRLDLNHVNIGSYLFNQFSAKLPNLKTLKIYFCAFLDQDGNPETNVTIDMPNTSLDLFIVKHYSVSAYFKVSTVEQGERYYKTKNQKNKRTFRIGNSKKSRDSNMAVLQVDCSVLFMFPNQNQSQEDVPKLQNESTYIHHTYKFIAKIPEQ